MSLMLDELTQEVIKRIEASEGRSRSRKAEDQPRFEHAVHVLLTDLWQAVKSTPIRECSINKRSGWYSENPRYRDPLLTYKVVSFTSCAFSSRLYYGATRFFFSFTSLFM